MVDQHSAYTGNRTDGSSTALYGNVYGDVHFGGESSGSNLNHCLRAFRLTDPHDDKARIEGDKDKLLKSCYGWIFENPGFQRWRTDKESRLLWIKGDPGKGKTMMTMGIIDELSAGDSSQPKSPSSRPDLVAFFFCQNARPELNNAVSILRGLIYLLVKQKKDLMPHVQKQYDITGSELFEGPNAIYALKKILSEILHEPSLPMTYLVIDGLDECVSGLLDILHVITDDDLAPQSRLKWMVTSRNMPVIKRYLQPDLLKVKISLEVSASEVSEAVAVYVSYKVQQLAKRLQYDLSTEAEVKQVLCEKAEGTFLWVSLVCKELEEVALYQTRAVLQALPPRLDPLYKRMMIQISAQTNVETAKYCKEILKAMALAYRPLQFQEIAVVASLPSDLFHQFKEIKDLVNRCGSFLTMRQNVVSFIHLSAKDYLMSEDGQKVFHKSAAEVHREIAARIIDTMQRTLRKNICNIPSLETTIQKAKDLVKGSSLPPIEYACEHWVDHVQNSTQNDSILSDGGTVDGFLRSHLLHWIEAMVLLQKLPEAILAMQKLQLVAKRPKSTKMAEVIHDALRFLMWSGSTVQDQPLQLYYGALVFTPKQSFLRRQFSQEILQKVKVKMGLDEDWGPLLQTLEGQGRRVNSVAFSPEGERIASAADDGTVRVWQARTGKLLNTFQGHSSAVRCVVFAPEGNRLASASDDNTVRVWDEADLAHDTLSAHTGPVSSVAFSPDGDQLASGSNDKTVRIWNATGQPIHTLKGSADRVTAVAFAPTGHRLASGDINRTIQVWDTKQGKPLYMLRDFQHRPALPVSLAFSATFDQVVSCSTPGLPSVLNLKTGEYLCTLPCPCPPESCARMAFSAAGDLIASTFYDEIRVFDATNGRFLYRFVDPRITAVTSVAFSPTEDELVLGSKEGLVLLWDLKRQEPPEGHLGRLLSTAISPMGDQMASSSWDGTIKMWDTRTGKVLYTLPGHTNDYSMAFSPAGNELATGSVDGRVRVWDVETGVLLHRFPSCNCSIYSVAFSPTGDLLASGCKSDGTVLVWNVKRREILHTLIGHTHDINNGSSMKSVLLSPAGDRMVSHLSDGTVRMWDIKTGNQLSTCTDFRRRVHHLYFSRDFLLVMLQDDTLGILDAITGAKLHPSGETSELLNKRGWLGNFVQGLCFPPSYGDYKVISFQGNLVAFGFTTGRLVLLDLPKFRSRSGVAFGGHDNFELYGSLEEEESPDGRV